MSELLWCCRTIQSHSCSTCHQRRKQVRGTAVLDSSQNDAQQDIGEDEFEVFEDKSTIEARLGFVQSDLHLLSIAQWRSDLRDRKQLSYICGCDSRILRKALGSADAKEYQSSGKSSRGLGLLISCSFVQRKIGSQNTFF